MMPEALVLTYPYPSKEYLLDTGVSTDGAGAVLSKCLEGQEQVVA